MHRNCSRILYLRKQKRNLVLNFRNKKCMYKISSCDKIWIWFRLGNFVSKSDTCTTHKLIVLVFLFSLLQNILQVPFIRKRLQWHLDRSFHPKWSSHQCWDRQHKLSCPKYTPLQFLLQIYRSYSGILSFFLNKKDTQILSQVLQELADCCCCVLCRYAASAETSRTL